MSTPTPRRPHDTVFADEGKALKRLAAAVLIAATLTATPAAARPMTCRDYVDLARLVGWPKSERAQLHKIMWRESRCNPAAHNKNDPWGGSYSLLQINGSNVGWAIRNGWITRREDLFQPRANLRVGLELWRLYGWKPWGTKSSITN